MKLALASSVTSRPLVFNEAFRVWVRSQPVSCGRSRSLDWHRLPCLTTGTPVPTDYALCCYSSPSFQPVPGTSTRLRDLAASAKPFPAEYMVPSNSAPEAAHVPRIAAPSYSHRLC